MSFSKNLKSLATPLYRGVHDFIFRTLHHNPLYPNSFNGIPVKFHHIADEHLQNPALDDAIEKELEEAGVPVRPYQINVLSFRRYLNETEYPLSYYNGGRDPDSNFTRKALEHFVSLDFLQLEPSDTFVDVAACNSPFHEIVTERLQPKHSYRQDLIFQAGVHGNQIGGPADQIDLPQGSVKAMTLHCALEHFEGQDDIAFFRTMNSLLAPEGRVVVLPFYLASEYTIHVDPGYNLLRWHRVRWDDSTRYRLRYANWYQHFSRHYDVLALQGRILAAAPDLGLTVYRVTNFREVDPDCYLRWIGVFERSK